MLSCVGLLWFFSECGLLYMPFGGKEWTERYTALEIKKINLETIAGSLVTS